MNLPENPLANQMSGNQANQGIPKSHLTKAILVTLLCCLPLGIPAIIHASKVERLYFSGNVEEAWEESRKANKWCTIAIIGAVALWIFYIGLSVLVAMMEN